MNVSKRVIGIGGSAIGPRFVAHALGYPLRDKLRTCFFDNTVPKSNERDLNGAVVSEGICVFGNRVTTGEHSYNKQLINVFNNFFVPFVEVLVDQVGSKYYRW